MLTMRNSGTHVPKSKAPELIIVKIARVYEAGVVDLNSGLFTQAIRLFASV